MKHEKTALICTVILLVIMLIALYLDKDSKAGKKTDPGETQVHGAATMTGTVQNIVQQGKTDPELVFLDESLHTPVPAECAAGGIVQPAAVPDKSADKAAVKEKDTYVPISECPWSIKTQKKIKKLCDGYGISFELIMSLAMRESDFRENLTGDNERAYGAFQIHYWEWKDLMDRLGYTLEDMYDPVKQADACLAILEIHYRECNRTTYALMAYNGGSAYAKRMDKAGRVSSYASYVKERADRWKERR